MSTAARPDPQRAAASAEHPDGDDGRDGQGNLRSGSAPRKVRRINSAEADAVAPPPPAPTKHAQVADHNEADAGSGSSEGLTPEGRTRLDHLETELDRLVRALATDSNSGSDGSDVDSLVGSSSSSSSSSSSEYHDDDDDETDGAPSGDEETATTDNEPNASSHTEGSRPQVDLFSSDLGGDDMMDAVEELLPSSAAAAAVPSASRSNVTSTTTTKTTTTAAAAAKFTLNGKKISYLTVTELHKEKRRLKRRLRELKNNGHKAADGGEEGGRSSGSSNGGSADLYYDMYRAITEQIAVLEWKELMDQTGEDGRLADDTIRAANDNSAGSFAAAARAGITQRGKQQSDLIRIVEEEDECEADDGTGANANAFDDSDSDAGYDDDDDDDDSSRVDADSDSDDSNLFDFSDDLEHEGGGGSVLGSEASDDHKHAIRTTSLFDEHFSSDLFSSVTSPPSPIKTSKPEHVTAPAVVESDSPLIPRKLFDSSFGATDASDTKSNDADSQRQEGSTNQQYHELVPVVILLMDVHRGTFDLLGVRVDWQKRRVQDLLDIVISSGRHANDGKDAISPAPKEKAEREIPVVSPLSCGSARPREDTGSNDLDKDDGIISTTSSIWNPPMEINVDASSRVYYDGLIQYRADDNGDDDDNNDGSLVEGMLLINCLGLRRYSVVPQEVLVAKPADMAAEEVSEHAGGLLKKLLRVEMLSCDNSAFTLSHLALERVIASSTSGFDGEGNEGMSSNAMILSFSPPFDLCTLKDSAAEKRTSSDADETGSTFITEDDAITQASDLLDIYPCSKDEDDDPHSPDALLKKSWDPQIGGFHVATSPSNCGDGRQGLLGGTANMQPPPTCRPRTAGTGKFSLKNLASIARGAKKQVNDTVIDRETMKYLRGRSNAGSKKYSKVVEETNQELSTEIGKSEDEKTSTSVASNDCAGSEMKELSHQ